jgi:SAM-dependent methyltransferase
MRWPFASKRKTWKAPKWRKLELGCGRKVTPGYVRVDANPNIAADWHGDVVGPMPWPDGSFDEIRAVDVLEHISYCQTQIALAEWARLLATGGRLYVQVPDCGRIMTEWVADPERWRERLPRELADAPAIIGVAWRIMGGHADGGYSWDGDDWRLNAHYAMFTEESLRWYLERAGLVVKKLSSNFHPNLCCWAAKP